MGRRLQLQRVSSWLPCREYSTGVVAKNLHFHLQVGGRKKGPSPGVGFWKSQIPPQTLNASQNNSTHQEPRNQIEIGGGGAVSFKLLFPPTKKIKQYLCSLISNRDKLPGRTPRAFCSILFRLEPFLIITSLPGVPWKWFLGKLHGLYPHLDKVFPWIPIVDTCLSMPVRQWYWKKKCLKKKKHWNPSSYHNFTSQAKQQQKH